MFYLDQFYQVIFNVLLHYFAVNKGQAALFGLAKIGTQLSLSR